MNKPHKHAALIKAWADGAEIQVCKGIAEEPEWIDISTPNWHIDMKYRIKPVQTDLEIYGVEVGDIWSNELRTMMCLHTVGSVIVKTIDGLQLSIDSLQTLLFRRGIMDKL